MRRDMRADMAETHTQTTPIPFSSLNPAPECITPCIAAYPKKHCLLLCAAHANTHTHTHTALVPITIVFICVKLDANTAN